MKNFFLKVGIFSMALNLFTANAQSVFESTMTTESDFNRWAVFDANNDGTKWKYNADKKAAHYPYTYVKADDWIISPAISVEAGAYKLSYEYLGSSYGEKMAVAWGAKQDNAAMTNRVWEYGEILEGDNYIKAEHLISVSKAQEIFIGFQALSDKDKFKILVRNVKLEKAKGIDLSIFAINTVASGYEMGEENISLTLVNSGTVSCKNVKVSYKINNLPAVNEIVPVVEAGSKLEYTFAQKADFTETGAYTINAKVEYEGDEIPSNNEMTINLRHKGPASVPYATSFEETDNTEDIVILDLNPDPKDGLNGCWSVNPNDWFSKFSRTGNYAMVYFYSKNNPGDDWFFLEPIKMKAGYYSLKFWYSATHKETLGVYFGTAANPESMVNKVVAYTDFNAPEYIKSANVVKIETDGIYYFGFKCSSQPNQNVLCVDDLTLDLIEDVRPDLEIVEMASPVNGYVREQTSQNIDFTLENKGTENMNGATVKVLVDDQLIYEETFNILCQESKQIVCENALATLEAGKHNLTIEVNHELDLVPHNNKTIETFTVVKEPVVMYDFEDGKVPADFILKVADNGVVNKGLADIFPKNEAWAPVKINQHGTLGYWMLASASWLNGATADRWAILPKFHIHADNANVVWTANSADSEKMFAESYQVLVSTEGTETDKFKVVAEIEKENFPENPATRGISLAEYAGKDVNVAFRLVTKDGYFMTIDNIGVYGNVESAGIESVVSDAAQIVVNGNELVCYSDGVEKMEVYNVNGQILAANYNQNTLNIQSLDKGIYVARVAANGKVLVKKFVK